MDFKTSENILSDESFTDFITRCNNIAVFKINSDSNDENNENDDLTTCKSVHIPKEQIIADVKSYILSLPKANQTQVALQLIDKIHDIILTTNNTYESPFTHQVTATMLDDGTLLIEWLHELGRINFFIDEIIEESSIVIINNTNETSIPFIEEITFQVQKL